MKNSDILNIPAETYHADPCPEPSLSASVAITLIQKSPLHAWTAHPKLNPDYEPKVADQFDLGSAAHNMVLRQEYWREDIRVVDAADWRTKPAKEAKEAARAAGEHPVLRPQYEALNRMVSALERHPRASRAFRDGAPERTLVWRDADTGVWMRCRPDWMPDDHSVPWPDYKTTRLDPKGWDRWFTTGKLGMLRAAFYEAGIRATTGIEMPTIYYVVQEMDPPHAVWVRVVEPDSAFMKVGRAMLRKAVRTWAECLSKDRWPSYDLVGTLDLPEWAENRMFIQYADDMEQPQ